jgi:WD repeat-containing protein 89
LLTGGKSSRQAFEMVHLSRQGDWTLHKDDGVGLPGAHGEEIVRAFTISDEQGTVFTAGEDGYIKAWRPHPQ